MNDATDHHKVADLIKTHYFELLSMVRRKLNNRELADDLVAEAAKTALEHAHSGRLGASQQIAGYVFTIAMNLLRNHQRNMDNRTDLRAGSVALENIIQPEAGDEAELEVAQSQQLVRRMFASLGTRDREIIKRFYLDEQDKDEICRDLGLSIQQFNQAIHRARQRLKISIESAGFKKSDFFALLL